MKNSMLNMNTVATIIATGAIAIAGYFASSVQAVSNKVDQVTTTSAADNQRITDIDKRTSRIEDKIDTIISQGRY